MLAQITPITHEECVKGFQSVTTTCMLIDDEVGNWAEVGKQFGVRNVSPCHSVGYMIGPPGAFGPAEGRNITDFDLDGDLKEFLGQ